MTCSARKPALSKTSSTKLHRPRLVQTGIPWGNPSAKTDETTRVAPAATRGGSHAGRSACSSSAPAVTSTMTLCTLVVRRRTRRGVPSNRRKRSLASSQTWHHRFETRESRARPTQRSSSALKSSGSCRATCGGMSTRGKARWRIARRISTGRASRHAVRHAQLQRARSWLRR